MNKGDQTKEMILDTATALFAKKGYLGVTMQDVCDETGLSRGLYRHFDSCQSIFSNIITRMCTHQSNTILSKIEKNISALELVNDLFLQYEQELTATQSSLSLAICEFYREIHDDRMEQLHEQTRHMWRTLLQYGINRKEFQKVELETFIDRWLFSYQGLQMWSHILPIHESVKRIIHQTKTELIV